jgi:predicted permease
VNWVDLQVVLVGIAAMLAPISLVSSILALVLSKRPLRTGSWFYLGAFGVTLAIGIAAAFVLGNRAASHSTSTPKTWVAVVDLVGAVVLLIVGIRLIRRPCDPEQEASRVGQMGKVATSPPVAIIGAGALLANPGVFIPFALKAISETDPSTIEYIAEWVVFVFVAMLPLAIGMLMLLIAPEPTNRVLGTARDWLGHNLGMVAGSLAILLAASLLRGGIAGLTN